MPVPVFLPPNAIDDDNVSEFRAAVVDIVERHGAVVIDCSELRYVSLRGMRSLENLGGGDAVTLANPSPVVRLLAAVFGVNVDQGLSTSNPGRARAPLADAEPLAELTPIDRARLMHVDVRVGSVAGALRARHPLRYMPER